MFRLSFAGLVSAILLVACEAPEKRVTTITDQKVVAIMTDLHYAEAATVGLVGVRKDSLVSVYYDQVFALHKVSEEEYRENLEILSEDVPRFQKILNEVEEVFRNSSSGEKGSAQDSSSVNNKN